ncbi:MAG TPA: polysaccharide biosynthesis/export family protein [Myxococcaceae bacterium]|nr:polysaccharide biosynthesis/export family protein [Myxococcaceae bacterium]
MTPRPGSCALLVLVALACVQPRGSSVPTAQSSELPAPAPSPATSSTLGAGDLLEVRVFEEADLSGPYRVSAGGTIDFPLCGKVKVEGLNGSSAADVLTKCLGEKYLKRPQVSVLVREYNSKKVFVFGEVQKPGTFPYEDEMSIIQAITVAGGFSKLASKNDVAVTRIIDGKETRIRVRVADIGTGREKNLKLLPGDIVFVPESLF